MPVQFSLDGEMFETTTLAVDSQPGALRFLVGPSYDPDPLDWSQREDEVVR
jgi:diacylglycerol kinase family enzyme